MARLAIVTATTDRERAERCIASWSAHAFGDIAVHVVDNGPTQGAEYLGTVPAFRQGIDTYLLFDPAVEILCCFHDDLEITEYGWDLRVLYLFDRHPACGLAGFGGATGLGSDDLYQAPYAPMQLARQGFRSNLIDAEQHGVRSLMRERVVCLDGFSQIGRRGFWEGRTAWRSARDAPGQFQLTPENPRPWTVLEDLGVIHHFYDGMLGCLARRYGWEVWYLPIACRHYGGQTAVGDPGYQDWAKTKTPEGDHGFWEQAHKIGYEAFRDVLPLRL